MLQLRNEKKILIEEEKTGMYHVKLQNPSGEIEQDFSVSPDFFAEVLFGSHSKEVSAPEVKSLRWLANMFPYTENPEDETDKITNAIHVYTTAGANKIEMLQNLIYMKSGSGK